MRISDWSADVCSSDLEQEERRIVGGGAADRRGCRAGEHVGQVVLFPVAVADRVAVLVHHVVVVTVAGAVPLVPAGWHVAFRGIVLVHVLADQPGAVAGSLQPGCDGGLIVAQRAELERAAGGQDVSLYAMVVRVLAG